jgi:pyridoxine/pyridoxamine 5'-phosphate oxidase
MSQQEIHCLQCKIFKINESYKIAKAFGNYTLQSEIEVSGLVERMKRSFLTKYWVGRNRNKLQER